jgi:Transposase DDE domain
LGVDTATGEILAHALTPSQTHEGDELPGLLAGIDTPVAAVYGDKAYDAFDIHSAILARGARPVIPPRKGAAIRPPPRLKDPPPTRGAAVARIAAIGRTAWKQETGYHRRSLAETAMFRYKTLIGPGLNSRTFDNQKAEAAIAVRCINRFTALGMPASVKIG